MVTAARRIIRTIALAAGCFAALHANAALFGDDEARKAILELREQVTQLRQDNSALKRSLLDMQNQIDQTKADVASLRGQSEQAQQNLQNLQNSQKTLGDKLKQFEPAPVSLDGMEFNAEPNEKRDYEAAFASFRSGDFSAAQTALKDFVQKYPSSGYQPSALFWLGNAQYATKNYAEAITNFRKQLSLAPQHARAADAMLAIANCQAEMKNVKAARATLAELSQKYPGTDAARDGQERLARLK